MKKFSLVLGSLMAVFFISCTGPQGPPGVEGLRGFDGEPGIQAQIFEVDGVDLFYVDADNVWETSLDFSEFTTFEVLKEDAVFVFRFDGNQSFTDGTQEEAWGLIPQNFFLDQGIIQYVSSHTLRDVGIFIDGNFDLINLNPDLTDNQLFRVVIVPALGAPSGKMDTSSMSSLMASLGMTEADIIKVQLD